ncbi:uncharacterized protein PHACADRAFT_202850 [Phanerochaete carnosa HHB-10118-sp]|uniref:Uncharacterized protein n=1 Tax=Phanerochaete carnosa (strain HHB-10118-sp) TaxID=650164 RepID=K5VNX9_PHACS|nr:uncharacterized protein PHACADRAFT_202850 [Phanerochaete carnosa HHB-10118-sp]EKM48410.1 hypothetical protein PHACADRAFT_202850 [Phanerochaete carnosa HHB-10118-sp]
MTDGSAMQVAEALPEPSPVRRYSRQARFIREGVKSRVPWRHRKRRKRQPETQAEKEMRAADREKAQDNLKTLLGEARAKVWDIAEDLHKQTESHSAIYFYHLLMQHSRKTVKTREINPWNAYLHMRLKQINKETPEGGSRRKPTELAAMLKAEWDQKTPDEKNECTREAREELKEQRETKKAGGHNVPLSVFHDVRATIAMIERELIALYYRTGVEIFLMTLRGDTLHYAKPHLFYTSEIFEQFFQMSFGVELGDWVQKLECYKLGKVPGVKEKTEADQAELRKRIAAIVLSNLQEAARPHTVEKMNYLSFDSAITLRYGVVCEHYPLNYFCGPGGITTVPALRVLFNSWHSGTTRFRRLSQAEYDAWVKEYEARSRAGSIPAAPVSVSLAMAPVPPLPMGVFRGVFALQSTPALQSAAAQPQVVSPQPAAPSISLQPAAAQPEITATQPVIQPTAQPEGTIAQLESAVVQPTVTFTQPAGIVTSPALALHGAPSAFTFVPTVVANPATVQAPVPTAATTRTHATAFGDDGASALALTKRKRRDAGVKRGPNIRTLRKQQAQAASQAS